jgi:hypothetical protein
MGKGRYKGVIMVGFLQEKGFFIHVCNRLDRHGVLCMGISRFMLFIIEGIRYEK